MPSEFNHIDDFIRAKNAEAGADFMPMDRHWQEMSHMLQSAAAPAKAFRLLKKLYWMLPMAAIIVSVVIITFKDEGKKLIPRQVSPPSTLSPAVPENKSSESRFQPAPAQNINEAAHHRSSLAPNLQPEKNDHQDQQLPVASDLKDAITLLTFVEAMNAGGSDFLINNEKDTLLRTSEGFSLGIPANAFEDGDGQAAGGFVTIRAIEAKNVFQLITDAAPSISIDEWTLSDGAYIINAFDGARPLRLRKDLLLNANLPGEAKISPVKFNPVWPLSIYKDTFSLVNNKIVLADQGLPNNDGRMIKVLDLANDPRWVKRRGKKNVALFVLSDNSKLTPVEARAVLEKKYGHLYQEIRVRTGWKPNYRSADPLYGLRNGLIGDSVYTTIEHARALDLISAADSLQYEKAFSASHQKPASVSSGQFFMKTKRLGLISTREQVALPGNEHTDLLLDPGPGFQTEHFYAFLLLEKYNALLRGKWQDGKILFGKVPVGEEVSLVLFGLKQGKMVAAIRQNVNVDGQITGLQFEAVSPGTLREKIMALEKKN